MTFPTFFRPIICLWFGLCLLSTTIFAQKNLALENVNKFKRIIYQPGEPIRFQVVGDKKKYEGRIESVNDSMMVIVKSIVMENEGDASNRVHRDYIRLQDIRAVYKRPQGSYGEFFYGMMAGGLTGAGLMFVVIGPIDAGIAGADPINTNFFIGAGMLVTGLIMGIFKKRKHRVGRKWLIKPMNPLLLPPKVDE